MYCLLCICIYFHRTEFLGHMKDYFQAVFKIDCDQEYFEEDIEKEKVTLTCVGTAYSNVGKPGK